MDTKTVTVYFNETERNNSGKSFCNAGLRHSRHTSCCSDLEILFGRYSKYMFSYGGSLQFLEIWKLHDSDQFFPKIVTKLLENRNCTV